MAAGAAAIDYLRTCRMMCCGEKSWADDPTYAARRTRSPLYKGGYRGVTGFSPCDSLSRRFCHTPVAYGGADCYLYPSGGCV